MSKIDDSFQVLDIGGGEIVIPVIFTLALVVGLFEEHVVVAPITTRAEIGGQEAFDVLVESGRSAERWARLPGCPGVWDGDAVATFFQPGTLPLALFSHLQSARVAAMTEDAQALLRLRFSTAWQH
jgi:hypothetical protein